MTTLPVSAYKTKQYEVHYTEPSEGTGILEAPGRLLAWPSAHHVASCEVASYFYSLTTSHLLCT